MREDSNDLIGKEFVSRFDETAEDLTEEEFEVQGTRVSDDNGSNKTDRQKNSRRENDTDQDGTEKKKSSSEIIENTAEGILNTYNLVTLEETGEILYYANGVYVRRGEILIQQKAEKICGYYLTNRSLNEIIGHIRRNTFHSISEFDSDTNIINMKNGLYNIETGKLMKHTSTYLSVKQKPFSYNPNAKPKYFGKFLSQVLYASEIRTAVEFIAYTFSPANPFEIIVILHGIGANGKSVYLGMITCLHGSENVSNVPLHSMINNRFALADLEGKDVNIDMEMSNAIIASNVLKRLTGKHATRIERKNKDAYDININAKLIFSANNIPSSVDSSDGFYRRNIILSFPNQFIDGNEDPLMLNKLTTEEELSGIFNVLMPVLNRLLKTTGIFISEKTIAERKQKYERANDSIQAFLTEAVEEEASESDTEIKSEVYKAYEKYCKKYTLAIEALETFGKKLKKQYKDGRESSGCRRTFWKGIKITNEYRANPIQLQLISED